MNRFSLLKRGLLGQLGARLAENGFPKRPKKQTFEKRTEFGRVAVHLSFLEHETDCDVTTDIAIRFDAVEDLVHRCGSLLSEKEKTRTFTMGAELGNIDTKEPFRRTVSGSADVRRAVDALYDRFVAVGLPYLERYSQIEEAYKALSRDDQEALLHSPVHVERAKRACAMLVVMDRRSELDELVERKVEFLESIKDLGAPLFQKFLSKLATL